MWEGILWLEGFLGFEPRVAESQLLVARLCTGTLTSRAVSSRGSTTLRCSGKLLYCHLVQNF
jgi:hypothetical protein